MTQYLITIKNGNYPLTYQAKTITDAFMCLMSASENGHLLYKDLLEPDELMGILVSMKEGKTQGFEAGVGYKIERQTIPDPPAPPAPVPDWLREEQEKLQRFDVTATSKAQVDALNDFFFNCDITIRELALIVACLRIRPGFTLDEFSSQEDRETYVSSLVHGNP